MSNRLTKQKLLRFLERLGKSTTSPGNCFLAGGTSAVLVGWRETTIDIDLKFDPEPAGVFEAIPQLKRELQVNVELACPDDFIPPVPNWKTHSPFIANFGNLAVFHYDFVAQALAKLARGHERDLLDVREMLERKLVSESQLREALAQIRPALSRYPALDAEVLDEMINSFFKDLADG